MKIDVTSLCFGFKIDKQNDSGTPAWATSIGQTPKEICFIDTDIEGLSEFVYGMMFKSHSDWENLQDRNVVGISSSEEPKGNRERMMFSVFDEVYVNNIRVDGIYTLTYEKEHSKEHNNRLHVCYAKYLTYKGHSNKETLNKMAKVLGCNEDACWFVKNITIINQVQLHFDAVVVNPDFKICYYSSSQRKIDWLARVNKNYNVYWGPTVFQSSLFNYPTFLNKAMKLLVENANKKLQSASSDDIDISEGKFLIRKSLVGWDKNILKDLRADYYDNSFTWYYNGNDYVLNKELSGLGLCGFCSFFNELLKDNYAILSDMDKNGKNVYTIVEFNKKQESGVPANIKNYLPAIKSKPFVLLAGISGTGKSRIVRELAYLTCPKKLQDDNGTTPGNYCMIEVKPNWHDSTELLGYYSSFNGGGYRFSKFDKFVVKAWLNPDVPFFVCLDEMNLAPVEQYFAEFLSVLETRSRDNNGQVVTGAIIDKKYIPDNTSVIEEIGLNNAIGDWGFKVRSHIVNNGLSLPPNLIVIGTVNMDDTTYQFSRKVIDRAMTIEMNGGNLSEMFGNSRNLQYRDDANILKVELFKAPFINADEVLDRYNIFADVIKETVPNKLDSINSALEDTPFQVSYRVLNELVIYLGTLMDEASADGEAIDNDALPALIDKAVDQITLMKVLPRIEGDEDMFRKTDGGNVLIKLQSLFPENADSYEKLKEMIDRLNRTGFTRFWP